MVTMEQLQSFMRNAAKEDAERKSVNVSGESLEEALREASVELALPLKKIEYEILEKGAAGFMGMGKKPWLLIAYPAATIVEGDGDLGFDDDFGLATEAPRDRDGAALVRLTPGGVMLKVLPPVGEGAPLTERGALQAITARRVTSKPDGQMIAKAVKKADAEWVRIADYEYDPTNDPEITCTLVESEMKAVITMTAPGPGGVDPTADSIRMALEMQGVVHGIDEEVLAQLEEEPRYREQIVVAVGSKPKHGADARMDYHFRVNREQMQVQARADGSVDFKELNLIENVVEGQVLARKRMPEAGEPGQTVTGRLIPAKDGKDIDVPVGENTRLSDDRRSVLADMNGLVKLSGGKITVEPIYLVEGDVNMKSGNIRFLGTVVVKGNVDDGFTVNAAGDIEVLGNVGKSELEAEGDIIVHQGISGRSEGKLNAGGNVWAKFIENASVESGDMVVVSDGIINSTVFADKRIICRGKRASIVGGHIRAGEEVDAKSLGSVAGMETLVEVGYDPKSRERLLELEAEDGQLMKQVEELELNISRIEQLKQNKKPITKEKVHQYAQMRARREKINRMRGKLATEMQAIQTYLDELRTNGRISVSGTVFPGVKVAIKDATLPVRHETRAVTYVSEGKQVKVTRYEESRVDISVRKRGEGGE